MRTHGIGAIALLTLLAGASGARAQAPQTAPPSPLGQPLLDTNGFPREDAFLRLPLRPEDARYGAITGERLREWMMEVDAISLADRDRGNLFWGRNVGTWGHEQTQAWVERKFRDYGLENVYRQPFQLDPVWELSSWDITFASGGSTFALESARPPEDAESTPPGGLELDLVWVGLGSEADFLGRDVRGKAVLVQDLPLPGDIRHSVALEGVVERAWAHGAAAIGIVYGMSDNFAMWQNIDGGPGFNVGYQDGMRLRDMLGRGERVTVRLSVQSRQVEGRTAASVWGTLPGRSEEEILVIAHMDAFFQGASDNAGGLAVMIGLIDYFSRTPRAERPRTLRFLGSVGHHGGPGTRWLNENRETALANTVFAINLEHVAITRTKYWGPRLRLTNAVSPMRWWLWASPQALDVVLDALQSFNVTITADMDPTAAGEMGPMARDVPSIQVITSPEIKHTEQDTPEWVPTAGLEQIARAYAKMIEGLNRLERDEIEPRVTP